MKKSIFLLIAACLANTAIFAQTCLPDDIAYKVKNEGFAKSQLEEIVFTDSIPYTLNCCSKLKQLTIADMFAETIQRVMNNESISDQYII